MKPSYFIKYPWDSIFKNYEYEAIAKNVMIILNRTGNEFRMLTWKEYKEERIKDNNGFYDSEKKFFDCVVKYCSSPELASSFSPNWKIG